MAAELLAAGGPFIAEPGLVAAVAADLSTAAARMLDAVAALAWPAVALVAVWRAGRVAERWLARDAYVPTGETVAAPGDDAGAAAVARLEALVAEADRRTPPRPQRLRGVQAAPAITAPPARLPGEHPRAGATRLAARLQTGLDDALAAVGQPPGRSLGDAALRLRREGLVSPAIAEAAQAFAALRSTGWRAMRAQGPLDARVAAAAAALTHAAEALPRQVLTVVAADLMVFADSGCREPRPGVTAVLLEGRASTRERATIRVCPTRSRYRVGSIVAWEWDPEGEWGESWIIDPESGKPMHAWSTSLTFVGSVVAEPSARPAPLPTAQA